MQGSLRVIVKLRVDVVDVAVKEEGERRDVLETGKIGRGTNDAGEHEELVELVVTDGKRMTLRFRGSIRRRLALLHQRIRMLRAQLRLLHIPQKLQKGVAVRVVGRQALAQRELEALQRQVLLLVDLVEL
jgi:hypothetical protein